MYKRQRLGFYSNSVENSLQHTLAERLGALSGYDDYRLFLCNSGAEANENALKLASFRTGRAKVLAFGGAFHGRTSGAVEVTDNPAIRSPFNATANVEFVPLNDIGAVERKLAAREFAAVIVEGIQGVAGIRCPEEGFLRALREATERTGTVLILDEIQSGYGRTGRFFAHQWAGIRPDLITDVYKRQSRNRRGDAAFDDPPASREKRRGLLPRKPCDFRRSRTYAADAPAGERIGFAPLLFSMEKRQDVYKRQLAG